MIKMNARLLGSVLLYAAAVPFARAQNSSPDQTALLSLPQCALNCILAAVPQSPCAATNQTCLCRDQTFQQQTTICVTSNCTIKEALFTKNTTSTLCREPVRNRQYPLTTTSTTLGVLSGFFVLLRFGFKLFNRAPIASDDWLILITITIGVPSSVITVHGTTAHGLGRDIWTVPFNDITLFGMYFYILEVIYFAEVALLKLSLLAFFLRIFPGRTVRMTLWVTAGVVAVYGLVFVLLAIFQCSPVYFFWTKWDGETAGRGRCLDNNDIAWVNAGISIVLDIWMLAIPLHQLRGLQLHWKKKIGVGMMFCVGAFVTIVSILRLQSLVTFANSLNPTWDNWDVSSWSTIEINVGIICACMPSLRLLLVRMFPALRGSSAAQYGTGMSAGPRSRVMPERQGAKIQVVRVKPDPGIVYTKSFTVEHGLASDHDQASLVPMQDLDWKGSKSGSIRSEISSV